MRLLSLFAATALSLVAGVAAQEATCYAPNGDIADNHTYVPCNKLGINQAGIFSSCCALDGPVEERDICASSGLCINRQGQPQRGFCTDKDWKSKACVQVCMDEHSGGTASNSSFMTSCNDGTGEYCCGRGNTTCCGTSEAFTIPIQESVCTANTSNGNGSGADDLSTFKSATIALAVVAGVSLLAGLVSVFWLWKQNKTLKRELAAEKTASSASNTGGPTVQPSPATTSVAPQYTGSYAGDSQHLYKPPYGSTPGSPHNSEFHGGNPHRYSELDASTATARSEMGSPSPYDQLNHSQLGRDSPIPENQEVRTGSPYVR
ncbi:hypothetical protein CMUS01_02749 [Colletotrichum musicola]|uniref:Uncharacterized protein n=1 Tax=Colletotrichum musicola TaxID=2175873 RepID=A0A8H6U761_9PEZI|nr:hypothetical protein CMUS01_02749 [Colletotrichum musicola]